MRGLLLLFLSVDLAAQTLTPVPLNLFQEADGFASQDDLVPIYDFNALANPKTRKITIQNFLKSGIVTSIAELTTIKNPAVGQVVQLIAPNIGGVFYITNNVTSTNTGTKYALSTMGYSAVRVIEGPINVKWFGAKGDDATEVHAAINAALQAGAGKEVYVPPDTGAYIIGATLLIPSGTTLRIHGTIKAKAGVNFELIREDGGTLTYSGTDPDPQLSNIALIGDNLGIVDGNSLNAQEPFPSGLTAAYTGHGIRIIGVDGVLIQGLKIKDCVLFALAIQACKNIKVLGNTIDTGNGNNSVTYNGKNQDGIHLFDSQDFTIANNVVESSDDNIAVTVRDCYAKNGVIAGNICKSKIVTTGTYAVIASNCRLSLESNASTNAYVQNITVANNDFKDGANAMYLDSINFGMRMQNIIVLGNNIHDKTDLGTSSSRPTYGIFCQGIQDIYIQNNTFQNMARYGVYAQSINRMVVDGNGFYNFTTNQGIARNAVIQLARANGSLTNVIIRGNTFTDCIDNAIAAAAGVNNVIDLTIENNRIYRAAYGNTDNALALSRSAIRLGQVTRPTVRGNVIQSTAATGMEIYNSPNATVVNNTVISSGASATLAAAYGIYVYHDTGSLVDAAIVEGNKVTDCDGKGIFVRNVERVVISNNMTRNNCAAVTTEQEILYAITGDGASLPVTSNVSGAIHGNTMFNSTATVKGLAIQLLTSPAFTGTPIVLWDNTGIGMTTKLDVSTANSLATDSSIFGGQLVAGAAAVSASSHHYLYYTDTATSGTKTAALIERQYNAAGAVSVAKDAATVINRFAGSGGSSSVVGGLNVVSSQDQVSDNVSQVRGISTTPRVTGAGTASTLSSYISSPSISGAGNVTNLRQFWSFSPSLTSSGVITTSVGHYIDQQKVTGVTTGWGIYQASTADQNYFAGPLRLTEVSTPNAPSANEGTVFLQDNGAGKTQLAVRFNSGAVQVIATEP